MDLELFCRHEKVGPILMAAKYTFFQAFFILGFVKVIPERMPRDELSPHSFRLDVSVVDNGNPVLIKISVECLRYQISLDGEIVLPPGLCHLKSKLQKPLTIDVGRREPLSLYITSYSNYTNYRLGSFRPD